MSLPQNSSVLVCVRSVIFLVVAIFLLSSSPTSYAGQDEHSKTGISFDTFIDQTTGDEVPKSDLEPQKAYRGKRVYKSIFRWIDIRGYYFGFKKRFQEWCTANGGHYVINADLDADCFDGKGNQHLLGGYMIQIVATDKFDNQMTAGYATFYFFRQQELTEIQKERQLLENQSLQRAVDKAIEKQKIEAAEYQQSIQDQPVVKRVGQKICKTVQGETQPSVYIIGGKEIHPDYLLVAFTENAVNDKIQIRIAAIKAKLPAGAINVDHLDGDITLQVNTVTWDDPMLWHPCN